MKKNDEYNLLKTACQPGNIPSLAFATLLKIATIQLSQCPFPPAISPSKLIQQAWFRIALNWKNMDQLFRNVESSMNQLLSSGQKSRHESRPILLEPDEWLFSLDPMSSDLLALNETLNILEVKYPAEAETASLIIFGGMTVQEAAVAMNQTTATALRQWHCAKWWLFLEMSESKTRCCQ